MCRRIPVEVRLDYRRLLFASGAIAAPAAAQDIRVTAGLGGQQPNGTHGDAVISGDGRFAAFWSQANNLVAGDGNTSADVFVRDLTAGTTTRASVADDGLDQGIVWAAGSDAPATPLP